MPPWGMLSTRQLGMSPMMTPPCSSSSQAPRRHGAVARRGLPVRGWPRAATVVAGYGLFRCCTDNDRFRVTVARMLWLKAFHVVFVVTWFAGLFYLPRLFVYFVEATEPAMRARLKVMQRRLLVMTHIGGALAVGFGLAVLGWWQVHVPGYLGSNVWLQVKLVLVACLVVYHFWLVRITRQLARDDVRHSSRWLRLFNEVPSLLLIAIVILVIVKPF